MHPLASPASPSSRPCLLLAIPLARVAVLDAALAYAFDRVRSRVRSRALDTRAHRRDQPLVHFAVIDTDAWIYPTEWSRMEPQWSWLQADLAKVNRTVTPWIVVYGHRALYCGYDSNTECLYETDALRYGRLIGGGSGGQREYVPDRSQGGMNGDSRTH